MEWTFGMSAALISCLYLSIVTTQVSGKCKGFKQACYGGNGKRSDPNFNLSPSQSASSIDLQVPAGILSKVLISDIDRLQGPDSKNSWLGSVQTYLSSRSTYPDSYETGSSLRSLRADDTEPQDHSSSYQARLELALAEMAELRKYIAILENMLRASGADLA